MTTPVPFDFLPGNGTFTFLDGVQFHFLEEVGDQGERVAFITFRDKRAFITRQGLRAVELKDNRAMVTFRDKRAYVRFRDKRAKGN